jgi:hypothetical protein
MSKPTFVQRYFDRRSRDSPKLVRRPAVSCIRTAFRLSHLRTSHSVYRRPPDFKSTLRMIQSIDPETPNLRMTPLKSRPNRRVIHLCSDHDSPDQRLTENSEVYKQYTRLPVNKENRDTDVPTVLMNELLLFLAPATPLPRVKPRVRLRALMHVPTNGCP